jgi:nucleoporin SEH1
VIKIAWAHPEFGQSAFSLSHPNGLVLASTSFDRSVRIWEEQEQEPKLSDKRWIERARLVDARGIVSSIAFAPNRYGLVLAAVGEDGHVRIYEAQEVTNVSHWLITHEIEVDGGFSTTVAGNELASCISWSTAPFRPPMFAVCCGQKGIVKLFRKNMRGQWQAHETITLNTIVHDVAFAPSMGRSYQLLAACGRDHRVHVYKLTESVARTMDTRGEQVDDYLYSISEVANFVDHNAEVFKVSWNISGTILASSGDDGKVRLWKATHGGDQFKALGTIHGDHGMER